MTGADSLKRMLGGRGGTIPHFGLSLEQSNRPISLGIRHENVDEATATATSASETVVVENRWDPGVGQDPLDPRKLVSIEGADPRIALRRRFQPARQPHEQGDAHAKATDEQSGSHVF